MRIKIKKTTFLSSQEKWDFTTRHISTGMQTHRT